MKYIFMRAIFMLSCIQTVGEMRRQKWPLIYRIGFRISPSMGERKWNKKRALESHEFASCAMMLPSSVVYN